jgi:hypothetical protein
MMRSLISLCAITLFLLFGCGDGEQTCRPLSTIVPEEMVQTNRTIPEGCWLASQSLYVSNGALLTVNAGATIKFAAATGIEVGSDGALGVAGTSGKPVLLTGQKAERGFWDGVVFTNSDNSSNSLSHTTVEYAGAREMRDAGARPFRAAVSLSSSGFRVRASLTNCTLRESSGYGLNLDAEARLDAFTGNLLTRNASGASRTYSSSVHGLTAESIYTGNDQDLVFVDAAYEFGSEDRAWSALGVPYHVDGMFILESNLTLAPGMTLAFTHDAGMKINDFKAGITALGTADKPIIFTGLEKTPGCWAGLYFTNTNDTGSTIPRTHLTYVTIEYGGSDTHLDANAQTFSGNLMLDSSGWNSVVEMSNSTLQHSSGYGTWLCCESTLKGEGNTYSDNAAGDVGHEDCG